MANNIFTSPLPASFVGVDRVAVVFHMKTDGKEVKKAYKQNKIWPNPMIQWMQELYKRSNFSFTGVYLASDPKNPRDYPTPACEIERGWTVYYDQLVDQGWGTWLIYAPYTLLLNQKTNTAMKLNRYPENLINIAEERGTLHGAQIKEIVAGFSSGCAGSVVYIDNEGVTVPRDLALYLSFLFKEMSTLRDDGLQPVRPGLYAPVKIVRDIFTTHAELFSDFTDIFLWINAASEPLDPFVDDPTKVVFDTKLRPIWVCSMPQRRVILPVGEQIVLNYGGNVPHGGKVGFPLRKVDPALLQALPRQQDWDFNSSFVRDPRYPEAYPRFNSRNKILVCGLFNKELTCMNLEERIPEKKAISETGGIKVEPEAPLLLTASLDLFTLDTTGLIVTSQRSSSGTWTPLSRLPTGNSDLGLRRLRALTALSPDNNEAQVFYVSRDFKLYGRRRMSSKDWTAPKLFASEVSTYYFASIASAVGYSVDGISRTTDVFFIDSEKKLHMATCSFPADKDWPGDLHIALEDEAPSLLPGTFLAAIAPSPSHEIVFGIDKKHFLRMAIWTKGSGWEPPRLVVTRPGDFFLHPHSKLAVLSPTPTTVFIAAMTQAGVPCIYNIRYDGSKWVPIGGWTTYRRFPGKVDPLDVHFQFPVMETHQSVGRVANSWNFNVYGDISLDMEGGDMILTVAASCPDNVGLMRRWVLQTDGSWFLLNDSGKFIPLDAGQTLENAALGALQGAIDAGK